MTSPPLSVTHPDLAAQAAGWDPSTTTKGSNIKRPWRCTQGHEWEATTNNRTKGTGCPVCSGRKLVPGVNDLATTHSAIAAQACGWDPTTILAGSHASRRWRCARDHEWEAALSDRKKGTGCPFCAGLRAWPGFNDLATLHPELADEALEWDPATVVSGSNARLAWRCEIGHEWMARVSHRTNGSGCPVCANKVVLAGFNDLATTHPLLASEADGWDPTTAQPGSTRRMDWRCAEDHRWSAKIYTRTAMATGCPVCAGRAPDVGVNDLATTHLELARQAVGWDPRSVKAASNMRVRWRCSEGHEWDAIVFSRAREGRGCPQCSGRVVTPGVNDLATLYPVLAAEVRDIDPDTLHAGTKDKVWWRCADGHEWEASVSTRTRRLATGCPSCASYGFDPVKPAWLYLMEHSGWGLLQIGITNVPDHRVGLHTSRGWQLLDLVGPIPGVEARKSERSILRSLSAQGATPALAVISERFDGYTEAWTTASYGASSLAELMGTVTERVAPVVPAHNDDRDQSRFQRGSRSPPMAWIRPTSRGRRRGMPSAVPTPRYRPLDLLKDVERWGTAGPKDWRLPQSPEEATRLVVSVEHERLAAAIARRLKSDGRSIPQLADAIGVSYSQLFAKLKGTTPLRPEEFVGWQWLLGEHHGIRVPKVETALSHVVASRRAQMTGVHWPFH